MKKPAPKAYQTIFAEGANGGSYVRFDTSNREGYIAVEVGHSCVRTVKQELPVTWLAAVLTHAKDIGFLYAMGAPSEFPADYALMCDPIGVTA